MSRYSCCLTIVVVCFVSLLPSCKAVLVESAEENIGIIIRPEDGQIYSANEKIQFLWRDMDLHLTLQSDIDGVIGTEPGFFRYLSGGRHIIQLLNQKSVVDEITIHVKYGARYIGERNTFLLNESSNNIPVRSDRVAAMLWNHFAHGTEVKIDSNAWVEIAVKQPDRTELGMQMFSVSDYFIPIRPFGSIKRSSDFSEKEYSGHKPSLYTQYSKSVIQKQGQEEKRQFYMPDLENLNYNNYVEIAAEIMFDNEHIEIWLDSESASTYSDTVSVLYDTISQVIVPRVQSLWGWWSDDLPLIVLFSDKLNQNGNILGFFNPADLFPADNANDRFPEAVYSNEARMVYVAVPSGDYPFNDDIILATIGHELQHLIHFYTQTYTEIVHGNSEAQYDELFLAEGLAHLTEVLIGYGITGGNIAFVDRYFQAPHYYPLSNEVDFFGRTDSAGKRGGMVSFLAWLVWEYGGIAWDEAEPGMLVENRAVPILRNIISSPYRGWKSIEYATGYSSRVLLQKWFQYVHAQVSFPDELQIPVYDALTLQPIHIPVISGPWLISETFSVQLSGPPMLAAGNYYLPGKTFALVRHTSNSNIHNAELSVSLMNGNAILLDQLIVE